MNPDPGDAVADATGWTPAAREFVEFEQEKMYRDLADSLGFGADAQRAYETLVGPPMPNEYVAVDKLRGMEGTRLQFSPETWQSFGEKVAGYMKQYFELPPPTKFEDPNWFRSMSMTFGQLRVSLERQAKFPQPAPLVATLPSGDVNARLLLVPGSDTVVVLFEQGLFNLFFEFAKLVAWSVPPLDPTDFAHDPSLAMGSLDVVMPPEQARSFYNTLYAYVVGGSPRRSATKIEKPNQNYFVAAALLQEMEYFVMAHELAHLTEGHLAKLSPSAEESWQQEYDADEQAVRGCGRRAHETSGSSILAWWAADVVLGLFFLLGYAVARLEFATPVSWISQTHPNPMDRQSALRRKPQLFSDDLSPDRLVRVGALNGATQKIMMYFAERIKTDFVEFHQQGSRPFPTWKEQIASSVRPNVQPPT